ncbi:hypothetical protein CU669_12420 [Paramagnetospirillum kuznetsovii]|uniref:Uncharacterized protein n=1 Tax=Paramagnetospirillum kuznetsovii TaxID=2053833 RepID=A0A364NWN4_9PROT|nr:hypothetical protein [Paramagnetospirillum kuznetsovii]RAU21501.1 hypothetical protein CU669_12420 [Paramagnetospirillum kuznetsovii]
MTLISSALSRLFSDPWERSITERTRQEPRMTGATSPQDGLIENQTTPMAALPPPAQSDATPRYDLRNISPRNFADLTHELYLDGTLSWDEFKMVGFPSELDPRFDETIGALTGEKANPDQPRDMLGQWEQRVDFEKRYNPHPDQVKIAEDALGKLSWLNSAPLSLSA